MTVARIRPAGSGESAGGEGHGDVSRTVPAARGRRPGRSGFLRGLLGGLAGLVAAAGCGDQPFPGSSGSLDELGRGIVEAFRRDDRESLESFRLTETEHNGVVWPELPAARTDPPFPLDLTWRNIELRNQRAVPRVSAALEAARPLDFESVECLGETRGFETFVVHTDCHTRLRTGERLYRIQLFKDVLERNGGLKIFRYYDEDLEPVTDTRLSDTGGPSR